MRLCKFSLLISLLFVALIASCSNSSPQTTITTPTGSATTSAQTPTSAPIKPSTSAGPYGELKVALGSFQQEKFDPVRSMSANAANLISPMLDSLFRLNGATLTPSLVEKWEVAPDGLSWIYYLRKGIKFQNGEDLTADDVKFSLDLYASGEAFLSNLRDMVSKIETIDDYTVRIYTKGTQPYLPYMSSLYSPTQGLIQPKDYIEKNGQDYFNRNPVGSGPFKFVRHIPGDLVEYEALDSHWRIVPQFKKVSLILMPEETTRVASLKTGTVDLTDVGLESALELESTGFTVSPDLITVQPGIYLYGNYLPGAAGMPTADVRVRQALSLAINRPEILKTFFYGKATMPFPAWVNETSTDVDVAYWRDYAANLYRYDLEEAKHLMKEAGYATGFSIKLYTYPVGDAPYTPKLAEVVQAYWNNIGVKAMLIPTDTGSFRPLRNTAPNRDPAPALIGNASTHAATDEPITPVRLATGYKSGGSVNLLGKAMPELDKLISDSTSEMDPVKRKEMLNKAIKMASETYTMLPIATAPYLAAISNKVQIDFNKPTTALSYSLEIAKHKK